MQPNERTPEKGPKYELATFAAGCFWGVEYAFSQVPGVKNTQVGFMGGDVKNPSYRRVCVGDTGHAEVVQIQFDPNLISYEKLVRIFFLIHDPTTLNRQGPDVGEQYRSAVFAHGDEQLKTALAVKEKLGKSSQYKRPIVTEVLPAGPFWKAEEYHQDYARKHPGSCHVVDMKKVMQIVNQ
ncbi:MAG: peptide-methionine (S)-S-oxide reductase MsrA [Planctomycetaceae bacterium]|nr:peptide-methionine (S)-S-oxide reductase MsrA [Planctomycetaceae bacterium]